MIQAIAVLQSIADNIKNLTIGTATKLGVSVKLAASFTSTNTANTDITGMGCTVVVPSGGKDLRVDVRAICSSTGGAGNNWTLEVYDTGSGTAFGDTAAITIPTNGFGVNSSFWVVVPSPTAGSHTYQVRYRQSAAGTFLVNAGAQMLVSTI
jgi:hypothetical protein